MESFLCRLDREATVSIDDDVHKNGEVWLVTLRREIRLPFLPFTGLAIEFNDVPDVDNTYSVGQIYWVMADGCFDIEEAGNCASYGFGSLDSMREGFAQLGWTVNSNPILVRTR